MGVSSGTTGDIVNPGECLAKAIVELLNDVCKTDRLSMHNLIEFRQPASPTLVDHPTIQTAGDATNPTFGLLGLLNGICGVVPATGAGWIQAVYSGDDKECGELLHFKVASPPKENTHAK